MTGRILAAALLTSTPIVAQWLDRPAPGIPRRADGKPNLSAPVPKTPDGKPDLSGVWEHKNSRDSAYYLDGIDIPWKPSAAALFKQRTEDNQLENPESRCLPRGIPKADAFDVHKIVQTPGLVIILYDTRTPSARSSPMGVNFRRIPIQPGWGTRWGIGKGTR
jgi:hypothetical protein